MNSHCAVLFCESPWECSGHSRSTRCGLGPPATETVPIVVASLLEGHLAFGNEVAIEVLRDLDEVVTENPVTLDDQVIRRGGGEEGDDGVEREFGTGHE